MVWNAVSMRCRAREPDRSDCTVPAQWRGASRIRRNSRSARGVSRTAVQGNHKVAKQAENTKIVLTNLDEKLTGKGSVSEEHADGLSTTDKVHKPVGAKCRAKHLERRGCRSIHSAEVGIPHSAEATWQEELDREPGRPFTEGTNKAIAEFTIVGTPTCKKETTVISTREGK